MDDDQIITEYLRLLDVAIAEHRDPDQAKWRAAHKEAAEFKIKHAYSFERAEANHIELEKRAAERKNAEDLATTQLELNKKTLAERAARDEQRRNDELSAMTPVDLAAMALRDRKAKAAADPPQSWLTRFGRDHAREDAEAAATAERKRRAAMSKVELAKVSEGDAHRTADDADLQEKLDGLSSEQLAEVAYKQMDAKRRGA